MFKLGTTYHSRPRFSIPYTKPIDCVDKDLPIEPYTLGVWLGDGDSNSNKWTLHRDHPSPPRQLPRVQSEPEVPS